VEALVEEVEEKEEEEENGRKLIIFLRYSALRLGFKSII
jgi:hypothetical protein